MACEHAEALTNAALISADFAEHKNRSANWLLVRPSCEKQGSTGRHLILLLFSLPFSSGGLLLSPLLNGVLHVQELVPCDQSHCGVLKCLLVQLQAQALLSIVRRSSLKLQIAYRSLQKQGRAQMCAHESTCGLMVAGQ